MVCALWALVRYGRELTLELELELELKVELEREMFSQLEALRG